MQIIYANTYLKHTRRQEDMSRLNDIGWMCAVMERNIFKVMILQNRERESKHVTSSKRKSPRQNAKPAVIYNDFWWWRYIHGKHVQCFFDFFKKAIIDICYLAIVGRSAMNCIQNCDVLEIILKPYTYIW